MSLRGWLLAWGVSMAGAWVMPTDFLGFMVGAVAGGFCAFNFGYELRRNQERKRAARAAVKT